VIWVGVYFLPNFTVVLVGWFLKIGGGGASMNIWLCGYSFNSPECPMSGLDASVGAVRLYDLFGVNKGCQAFR